MHKFQGKWITNEEFYNLKPRNVFHRQLDIIDFDCSEHRNKHILFRKKFNLLKTNGRAIIYISADDFYRLYIFSLIAGIVSLIMTLKIFPFEHLPSILKMLQFSFRMLEFSSFFLSLVAAINYVTIIDKISSIHNAKIKVDLKPLFLQPK